MFGGVLLGTVALQLFLRKPLSDIRPSLLCLIFLSMIAPYAAICIITYDREMLRFRGEQPTFRFNLRLVFAMIFFACLLLAAMRVEMLQTRNSHNEREAFTQRLLTVVGEGGKARYSGGTNELMIVVKRDNFGDDDFRKLVEMLKESPDNAYIYHLDLSGTEITDASIELMSEWDGLQYGYVSKTRVSPEGIRQLEKLPGLKHQEPDTSNRGR